MKVSKYKTYRILHILLTPTLHRSPNLTTAGKTSMMSHIFLIVNTIFDSRILSDFVHLIFVKSKKKSCSKEFCSIHMKTTMLESLFNKIAGLKACEYCKAFKNTFFTEHEYEYLGTFVESVLQLFRKLRKTHRKTSLMRSILW